MATSVYIFDHGNLLPSAETAQLRLAGFTVNRYKSYAELKPGLWAFEPDYLIWISDTRVSDVTIDQFQDVIKNFPGIPIMIFGAHLDAAESARLFTNGVFAVFPFHANATMISAVLSGIEKRKILSTIKALEFLNIELHPENQTATVKNNILKLTKTEFLLLSHFLTNQKKVLKKERLIEFIWKDAADEKSNYDSLYAHIKNLRKKLSIAQSNVTIQAIYGMGYKLVEKEE